MRLGGGGASGWHAIRGLGSLQDQLIALAHNVACAQACLLPVQIPCRPAGCPWAVVNAVLEAAVAVQAPAHRCRGAVPTWALAAAGKLHQCTLHAQHAAHT